MRLLCKTCVINILCYFFPCYETSTNYGRLVQFPLRLVGKYSTILLGIEVRFEIRYKCKKIINSSVKYYTEFVRDFTNNRLKAKHCFQCVVL